MRLIIAGVVLDIIAVLALVVLIFIPMMAPDFAPITNLMDSMLCETGEQYESRPIVTQDSEGTGYSLYAVCIGDGVERDVTPQQTVYGLLAFAVPFLPGLGLIMLGAARYNAYRNRPREVTGMLGQNPAAGAQNPLSNPQFLMQTMLDQMGANANPQESRSLSERLADVDQAYEDRRITREEYETLRKKIIDETNF